MEKKNQLQTQAQKLRGGLYTLNATRKQVAEMQVICQDKAVVVAKAKKECEEVLLEIISEKRIVDEQELKVCVGTFVCLNHFDARHLYFFTYTQIVVRLIYHC